MDCYDQGQGLVRQVHGPDPHLYCSCPIYPFSLPFSLISPFPTLTPVFLHLMPFSEHFVASCLFSQYCGTFYTIPKCYFSLHPISPIPLQTFNFQGVFWQKFWLILVGFTLGEYGLIDGCRSSWFTCSIFAAEVVRVGLLFCFGSLLDLFLLWLAFNQIT